MKRINLMLLIIAGLLLSACASVDEPQRSRPGLAQPQPPLKATPGSQTSTPEKSARASADKKSDDKKPELKQEPIRQPAVAPTPVQAPALEPAKTPMPAPSSPAKQPTAQLADKSSPPKTADTPAKRYVLQGQLDLSADDVYLTDDAASKAIVYYVPNQDAKSRSPGTYQIVTKNKRFVPEVMAIPVGSTVKFPNRDVILHNVFSVSPISNFDLGFYGQGEAKAYTFDTTGLSVVYCNVHYSMQTSILVLETPYFTQVAKDGSFRLKDIPAGSGTVTIWHPRADKKTQAITVPQTGSFDLSLVLTKPLVPAHLNKSGESYRPTRR